MAFGHTRADNPSIVRAIELRKGDVALNASNGGVQFDRVWIVKDVSPKPEQRDHVRIVREWWDVDDKRPCHDYHLQMDRPVLVEKSEDAS